MANLCRWMLSHPCLAWDVAEGDADYANYMGGWLKLLACFVLACSSCWLICWKCIKFRRTPVPQLDDNCFEEGLLLEQPQSQTLIQGSCRQVLQLAPAGNVKQTTCGKVLMVSGGMEEHLTHMSTSTSTNKNGWGATSLTEPGTGPRKPLKIVFAWCQPTMMTVNGEGKHKGQTPSGIFKDVAAELVEFLYKDDTDFNPGRDVQIVKLCTLPDSPNQIVIEEVQSSEHPKVVITMSNKKPGDLLDDSELYDIFFFGDEHQESPEGASFMWSGYYAQLGIDAVIPMKFAHELQQQEAVKRVMSGGKQLSETISLDLLVRTVAAMGMKLDVVSTPKSSFSKIVGAYFASSETVNIIGPTDVKLLTFKEDQLKEKVEAYNSSRGQPTEAIIRFYLGKADNFEQMQKGCGEGQAVLLQGESKRGLLKTYQSLAVSKRGGKHPKADIQKVQEFVDMLTSERGNQIMNDMIKLNLREGVVNPILRGLSRP